MDERTLKAIGDPKRFLLLQLMSRRGYCVSALAASTGLSESAVSQHLKLLREADLVYGMKRGYYTHYSVNKEAVKRVIEAFEGIMESPKEPCNAPFYGCPESEVVKCKAYVPMEDRTKED